jgi:hypothetical protein
MGAANGGIPDGAGNEPVRSGRPWEVDRARARLSIDAELGRTPLGCPFAG